MSIKYKLILTLNGFVTAVLLIFSFLIYTSEKALLLKQVETNYQNISNSLSTVAEESILSEDDLMLISYTLGLKKSVPELEFALVKNQDIILAHTDKKLIHTKYKKPMPRSKDFFIYKTKKAADNKEYDTIAAFSKSKTKKNIYHSMHGLFLRLAKTAIAVLAFSSLSVLWLSHIFTKPIKNLQTAFKEVGGGNLECALNDIERKDEIGSLNRSFNKMTRRLKELDEMKKDFISSVTHELKSPLGAIESYLNLMLYDINNSIKNKVPFNLKLPKFAENITFIRQNSNRLLNFITALLDTSKIEKGKFEIVKKKKSIRPIIKDTVRLFAEKAKVLNVNLSEQTDRNIREIYMDEERIRQVLINLVSNALKYTPEEGRVTISAKIVSDDFVEISVRDTGVGITQEYLKTIFDKFSQGKNKWISPAAGKGTGLGLYIAKTIIEAHNGFMYAESEEEKGSRFAFKLPLA